MDIFPLEIEKLIYSFNDYKPIKDRVINELKVWIQRKDEQCKENFERWNSLAWLPNFYEYYCTYLKFINFDCSDGETHSWYSSDWEDDVSSIYQDYVFDLEDI